MNRPAVSEARSGKNSSATRSLSGLTATGLALGIFLVSGEARALDVKRTLIQLHHTAWTLREGMPANLEAIAQTPDGYLWVGAASGLYRFDGIHLEPFQQKIPGGAVVALAVAPSGDLWIGSSTGISRLSHGRLTSFQVFGANSGVNHIAIGPSGDVWVASEKVARFDGHRWQVMNSDWGTADDYKNPGGVWGLAVARDGVVWTKNLLGLYFLRPGSTQFVRAVGYGGSIIDFASDTDGRLWTADVATRRFYALPDLGPTGPVPAPAQVGAAVPEGVLGHVMFDRDGALWCANSITGGLFRIRAPTASRAEMERFAPVDRTSAGVPIALLEDREGDIWAGSTVGLDRFSPANIVIEPAITIASRGAQIDAVDDAVYIADGWSLPSPARGHDAQKIYAITDGAPRELSDPIGNLTVLSGHGPDGVLFGSAQSLTLLRQGVVTPIPLPKTGTDLTSATQHDGDLWAVFSERGLFRLQGDVWTPITAPNLTTTRYTRIRLDQQGALWMFDGTMATRLTSNQIDHFAAAEGLDIGVFEAMIPDSAGILLAGLQGIAWFDGTVFHTLSGQQAPFLRAVLGVVADDIGATWIHTDNGIYRVSTQQFHQAFLDPAVRLDYQLFDTRDGLASVGSIHQFGGTAVRGTDGRLWFLNYDNVVWIDPHHLYRNPIPPPVVIKSVTVEGRAPGIHQKSKP